MTFLGLGAMGSMDAGHSDVVSGMGRSGVRWLRHLVFPGVLGASIAIVMEFFQLLKLDPRGAFALLQLWGPNFLLALVVLVIVGGLLSRLLDITQAGVTAQQRVADAISQIAQKDDRQIQEIQTLSAYTAQHAEKMNRRHKRMERVLVGIARQMKVDVGDDDDGE